MEKPKLPDDATEIQNQKTKWTNTHRQAKTNIQQHPVETIGSISLPLGTTTN
jgi:hypothetical protein